MLSIVRVALVTIAALGIAVGTATAQEGGGMYPGIGCKPLNQPADTVRLTEFYLLNTTPGPLPIVCPITWGGSQPAHVMIGVNARIRAQDTITCTALGASLVPSSTTAQTRVFARATQSQQNRFPGSIVPDFPLDLRFDVPTLPGGIAFFSLSCELPPAGRLYSYIVSLLP